MFRRAEGMVPGGAHSPTPGGARSPNVPAARGVVEQPQRRPNLAGDLEAMLEPRPVFRSALRGYDRLQVDNYVSWAETELVAARRENDDLLARYGAVSAELEISRRLLATSPEGRELVRTSERVGEILRLAADEAAQLTEAGAAEADRARGKARAEADAILRRAHEIKDAAVAAGVRIEEDARRLREQAAAELGQARAEAGRLLRDAAADRDRLAAEAAEERNRLAAELVQRLAQEEERARAEMTAACAAELAAARAEVEDLRRRREATRASLRQLTGQIDDALRVLTAVLAEADSGREQAETPTS